MALEHLQDDQTNLDIQVQRRITVGKQLHQLRGCQRIIGIGHIDTDQMIEAQCQMREADLVVRTHPPGHAIQRNRLLQLIRLHQAQGVDIIGSGRIRYGIAPVLQLAELHIQTVAAALLHRMALQSEHPHGIEEHTLVGIVASPVGFFE